MMATGGHHDGHGSPSLTATRRNDRRLRACEPACLRGGWCVMRDAVLHGWGGVVWGRVWWHGWVVRWGGAGRGVVGWVRVAWGEVGWGGAARGGEGTGWNRGGVGDNLRIDHNLKNLRVDHNLSKRSYPTFYEYRCVRIGSAAVSLATIFHYVIFYTPAPQCAGVVADETRVLASLSFLIRTL